VSYAENRHKHSFCTCMAIKRFLNNLFSVGCKFFLMSLSVSKMSSSVSALQVIDISMAVNLCRFSAELLYAHSLAI